jgi:hypothetical protein
VNRRNDLEQGSADFRREKQSPTTRFNLWRAEGDRRAAQFDGRDTDRPAPGAVRRQTHKDLKAIVDAVDRASCFLFGSASIVMGGCGSSLKSSGWLIVS